MKVLSLVILLMIFTGCKKDNTDKCWECEVTRFDGTKFKEKSCTENLYNKQYVDQSGNALQSNCYEVE
jgi:hypothetical protein